MGKDESEILKLIEQYSTIFNTLSEDVFKRSSPNVSGAENMPNPFNTDRLMELLTQAQGLDVHQLVSHQMAFMEKQNELWQKAGKAIMGASLGQGVQKNECKDRRFSHSQWNENPTYEFIRDSYLNNAEFLVSVIDAIEFADDKQKKRAQFFTRQYVNSLSPTNFVLTNPEVCEEFLATNGESMVKGMKAYLEDIEASPLEAFKMRQTKEDAFTLGENLANTPGQVVFRNDVMELIHYAPTQSKCQPTPTLIVPPFINKYYVLDLEPKKSLVKGLLDSGNQVFMISWKNPEQCDAGYDFIDYMKEGPLTAIEVVTEIVEQPKVNITGFCVGGTLSAMTAAYLRGKGEDVINSLTLLTTLLDFEEPGEVGNYFSEEMLPMIEQNAEIKGVFDGRIIAMSFSLLRENSLFWSFFIDNYLKGKDPAPFDILYWNSDSTNIPSSCFKQYLRMTYWNNQLKTPGEIVIDDVPIDLSNIDVPTYFLTTIADHIVLWHSAYQGSKLVSGEKRFVLAGSGHIAGVINPTIDGKYPHWTNDSLPSSPEEWQAGAVKQEGSWWKDWHQWLENQKTSQTSSLVSPLTPGEHECYPALAAAPGVYVKKRL